MINLRQRADFGFDAFTVVIILLQLLNKKKKKRETDTGATFK